MLQLLSETANGEARQLLLALLKGGALLLGRDGPGLGTLDVRSRGGRTPNRKRFPSRLNHLPPHLAEDLAHTFWGRVPDGTAVQEGGTARELAVHALLLPQTPVNLLKQK